MDSIDKNVRLNKTDGNGSHVIQDQQERFTLKPAFILMAISGCYSLRKKNTTRILQCLYNLVYLLLVVCALARYIYQFRTSPLNSLPAICVSFQCLGNLLICWKCFSPRFGNLHKALDKWNTQVDKMTGEGIALDFAHLRNMQMISVVLALVLQATCIAFQFIAKYVLNPAPDVYKEMGIRAIKEPILDTHWYRLAVTITMSLQMMTLVNPVCFLVMISNVIRSGLDAYNTYLEGVFKKDKNAIRENIGRFRSTHLALCSIITEFDKDFRCLYANMFFWSTGLGILLLYKLVKVEDNWKMPLVLMVVLFYLCLFLTLLTVTSISTAMVHGKAHEPLDLLYYIDVKGMSLEQAIELQLFLSKLTDTQVGFTLCGLLTITKEFILTITGVFLTYFAAIYTL